MADSILIVDDDIDLCDLLQRFLTRRGYETDFVHTASEMRGRLGGADFDLVILDITLPDGSGYDLIPEIRSASDAAIVMLTGRSSPTDAVVSLETGADDHVAKPFSCDELAARIRGILNRVQGDSRVPPEARAVGRRIEFGDGWEMNLDRRKLRSVDGRDVSLTRGEFELLQVFVNNPERVLARAFLVDTLGCAEADRSDRFLDNRIKRLRDKIERDPRDPEIIRTEHGVGYRFAGKIREL